MRYLTISLLLLIAFIYCGSPESRYTTNPNKYDYTQAQKFSKIEVDTLVANYIEMPMDNAVRSVTYSWHFVVAGFCFGAMFGIMVSAAIFLKNQKA